MEKKRIKKKIPKRVLFWLMAVILCMNSLPSIRVEASQQQVVRIPYGFNDFLKVDEDGTVSGYYAEYLEELAKVNNWKYEYVETTWPGAMEMLEEGEVDLLYPVNYSEERDEFMDYSDMPVGYIAAGIFALKDKDYAYEDFSALDGARIACDRGTSNVSELEELAKEKGFSYEIVYRNTNYELIEALHNDEADFAIFNSAAAFPEGCLITVLESHAVYLTVKEGNDAFLQSMNDGMEHLLQNHPEVVADTMKRTIAGEGNGIEAFTQEEKEYIDSGKEIRVGFYVDSEPLAYKLEDGSYDGVFVQYVEEIAEKTGINISLVPLEKKVNWMEKIRDGEIDFYIGASEIIVSKDEDIIITDSFMEYTNCMITRADCNFGQLETPVIALSYSRKNWAEYLKESIGREIEIQYYNTAKECMLAVVNEDVDAAMINNVEFNYQSKNERLSSLIRVGAYSFPTDICFATSDQMDEVGISVLNKAMKVIGSGQTDSMVEEYLDISYHSYSVEDYLYNSRYILFVVCLLLLVLSIILLTIRSFDKKREKIQEEARNENMKNLNILSVMSREYECIFYLDADKDRYECVYSQANCKFTEIRQNTFWDKLREYVGKEVLPDFRDNLLPMCDKQECIRSITEKDMTSIRYQVFSDSGEKKIYEMHFIRMDSGRHQIVFGIRCIDNIVQKEMEQQQILKDALDNANYANMAKSDFLSRMSHDIRTPMNAIIGLTVIADAHAEEPDRVRENLNKITSASRYLLCLINDVLDMSKIESGKMNLSEENMDLSEFVSSILGIMDSKIKEHNHEFHVDIQNVQHEKVIADSLRLQQIFMNILGNAVKYTPDGGDISLTIRELPVKTSMVGCYSFIFKDNGMGMTKEFQEHIFEPFQREEDLRISKIQGTGLGMSITRNLVQMMNGSIEVESEPDKGSTFTVTVMLKLQENEDIDTSEFENLSVLVADDDEDARESLCTMLGQLGMKGKAYTSGMEAVEAVKDSLTDSNPFDVAILDWRMPEMDGVKTAREIRKLADANLPIIILSAYDWSDIEEEARAAGVDLFLSKPVFKSNIIRLFKALKNGEDEHPEDNKRSEENEKAEYAGCRILLVEDNFLNREIGKEILEMEGIIVDEAENGQVGLDMFSASENGYYDMILMDIRMPVMNGYDATKAIRALKRSDASDIPIIAMTADAFAEDIQKAMSVGMNEHLAKPLDMDKLSQMLQEYLHRGKKLDV